MFFLLSPIFQPCLECMSDCRNRFVQERNVFGNLCKLVSVVTSLMSFVGFSVFVAGLTVAHYVCIAVYLTVGVRWFKQKLFLIQTPGSVPLEFVLGRFEWTCCSFVKVICAFITFYKGQAMPDKSCLQRGVSQHQKVMTANANAFIKNKKSSLKSLIF